MSRFPKPRHFHDVTSVRSGANCVLVQHVKLKSSVASCVTIEEKGREGGRWKIGGWTRVYISI